MLSNLKTRSQKGNAPIVEIRSDEESENELPDGIDPELIRRITRIILELRAVPIGTVLNFRTTTLQKCAAVPRRARI